MRTEVGVRQTCDRGQASSSHVLLAYSLAALLSVVCVGGNAEVTEASPLQLVSYSPADDFVVLPLKNSSTIVARVPKESLSSRYDVVSKPVEPVIPIPPLKPAIKQSAVIDALRSQAACSTGGMFDACAGFMTLLQAKQKAWPGFPDLALPATGKSDVQVASLGEDLHLLTEERIAAPIDQVSHRAGEVIMGAASMYNPYDADDDDAGGAQTASGELYDPIGWTAAIQIDLRDKFAGVRYGRLYQPTFALVELDGKRAIVKINDVGPLRPGRVIDFSQQAMHYFDRSLQRGVLNGVLVTPLVGTNWTPGPLGVSPAIAVASNVQ
jgi:peptidoglycan lytic transglycosylase